MPKFCSLQDPLGAVKAPFGVNASGTPIFDCLRILSGSVDIKVKSTGKIIRPRYCYLTQSKRKVTSRRIEGIVKIVFDCDLSLADAETFLVKSSKDNRIFWEEFKAELSLCITCTNLKKQLESFLYLYRLMELISIALPLVYASSEVDYKKALDSLKSLSGNPRDGELTVLANFISAVERNGGYENLVIDYKFAGPTTWHAEGIRQLRDYVFNEKKICGTFLPDDSGFAVPFSCVPHLISTSRNRMFHNTKSNGNFDLDALDGTDYIAQTLVQPTLYWLSLVLVEVTKTHARRYV